MFEDQVLIEAQVLAVLVFVFPFLVVPVALGWVLEVLLSVVLVLDVHTLVFGKLEGLVLEDQVLVLVAQDQEQLKRVAMIETGYQLVSLCLSWYQPTDQLDLAPLVWTPWTLTLCSLC